MSGADASADRSRRGVVVGTAGHVDHGKTALVRALTGVETDRWREERERGLTIDIGFARLELDAELETGVIDVPGHEDFLKNMLAGATGIDLLLLVVAADEGPMPQTREHLAIARLLDLRRGVVALSKRDRVDDEWLVLAEDATRELLEEHGRGSWPIVPVSATTGAGLEELGEELRRAAGDVESRRRSDLFRMPVDRGFSVHGTGTVVTGTVWSGSVETGDSVRLLPGDLTTRVRGLEVHGDSRSIVEAGRRCALALVGVGAGDAERGTVLVRDAAWRTSRRIGVRIDALAGPGRPIEQSQRVRVYVGTREAMARVVLVEAAPIPAGESGWAVLVLEEPLVLRARDRGILRFYSPVTTIGGIRVCEIDPPRGWPDRIEEWSAILDGAPDEALAAALELAGGRGLSETEAPIATGLAPPTLEAAAAGLDAVRLGDRWFARTAVDEAMAAVTGTVERLHAADRRAPGVSLEAVRSVVAEGRSAELVQSCIERHLSAGTLEAVGPRVSLPGASATLTTEEEEGLDSLRAALADAGLQPPTVNDLVTSLRMPRDLLDDLLRLLVQTGEIRAVTPEIYVDGDALRRMVARVRTLLAGAEPAGPAVFKDEFGLSRKYLIPLLEHLDREGVTRRVAEGRVLAG